MRASFKLAFFMRQVMIDSPDHLYASLRGDYAYQSPDIFTHNTFFFMRLFQGVIVE